MDFQEIKRIYDAFEDTVSKRIFEKRILYSLSGDKKHIDSMVMEELNRLGSSDIMNRCIQWITEKKIKEVSVFGAGFAGYMIVHVLKLFDIKVLKVYDNDLNKWGRYCNEVRIYSPSEIIDDENIIIGVNNYCDDIYNQITQNAKVRNIYKPDGAWWLGEYPQYFDRDIMSPSENEVFVDGGSLDGGDSINFAKWCEYKYQSIYAFEPDDKNVFKMERASEKIKNFNIYSVGMWSEKSTLRFSSGQSENCAISEDGDVIVEVDSIDNILNGEAATFIKMDIEGSEFQALIGARKTIKKYKPRLAICVYHKPEDIIDIPKKILELNPNYKLWLRHYSYVDTETVLYAVDGGKIL